MSAPSTPVLLAVVAAAAFGAAVRPAAAQGATRNVTASPPAAASVVAASPPAVRPLAIYAILTPQGAGLPTRVTVADSAGALVARYRLAGDRTSRPLAVTVLDTDLVLQGESPAGLLTLVLDGQNDAARREAVAGRWWVGDRSGVLRGRMKR